jgi:hypothetical protein
MLLRLSTYISASSFQVLNSMVAIHKMNQGTYDNLEAAKTTMIGRVGAFTKAFSPSIDELKPFKILLDVIGMSFVLAGSPIWNAGSCFYSMASQKLTSHSTEGWMAQG